MASVSKRQQARNERQLQDLIRSVPGNNHCADCQARNPGWASWSLGVFLCMRCASIHRKLGTHISKVKSLSMDTWSTEQVESMKRNGNIAVNKTYNPKNKKPDIPLDADEVDSAMEKFIRKKYQDKTLADGKPLPPTRSDMETEDSRSPENSPPPPLPPKKGKFFGFGLRASSSAYPLSKNDKKSLPREPRVDSAFRISSENYNGASRQTGKRQEISQEDIQDKLAILRDMGFNDERRNMTVLRGLDGNIERTIESLVKIQQANRSEGVTPTSTGQTAITPATSAFPEPTTGSIAQPSSVSTNPFDLPSTGQSFGLSFNAGPQQQQQTTNYTSTPDRRVASSNNPFDAQPRSQTDHELNQAFQSMQVSQPLFPHSTGGYPSQSPPMQDPRFQYSMTPPVPHIPQQYGYTASPSATNTNMNPFQPAQSSPAVASNPYASLMQSPPPLAVSSNPFFGQSGPNTSSQYSQMATKPMQQQQQQQRQASLGFNPFGIPPSQPESPPQQGAPSQPQSFYEQNSQALASNNSFQNFNPQQVVNPQQAQFQQQVQNFQYGQSRYQQSESQFHQQQYQQPQSHPQQQLHQSQAQFQPQQQDFYTPQGHSQPMLPQQTGRIDKSSILALYNYPQLAPQPLASIPEPSETQQQVQQSYPISPASSSNTDIFSTVPYPQALPAKRSATMPISASSMHSAGGGGSRNPFLSMNNNSSGTSTPMQDYASFSDIPRTRHASAESVSVNNAGLESGRHSPDAFASLSARYVR